MSWKYSEDIEVRVDGDKKSVQGTPAVVTWKMGQLHVFVHGKSPDASIYYGSNQTNSWQWKKLPVTAPATIINSIAAVSWGENRIDLFAAGGNNKMYHCAMSGTTWDAQWDVVPDPVMTNHAPAAASWRKDRMDVFIITTNNQMSNQHFENEIGKQWGKWVNAGGHMKSLNSAPAAAASGLNRIDCFAMEFGNTKHLLHTWYEGSSYDSTTDSALRIKQDWVRPDEPGSADERYEITGAPAASSSPSGTGRVDVFARSTTKRLIHREFLLNKWTSKWEELGDYDITGDPGAASWCEKQVLKRIDCLAVGTADALKHTWWT